MATLKQLRRRLAGELVEPFFVDIPKGFLLTSTAGTKSTAVVGVQYQELFDRSNYWERSHIYFPEIQEECTILEWDRTTGTITFVPDLLNAVDEGVEIEIHSRVTATAKHNAINDAIEQSFPAFYEMEESYLIIPENVPELTSSHNLPTGWRRLYEVMLEPPLSMVGPFTATAATNTTFTVPGSGWTTNQYSYWEVGIVDGSGVGQFQAVKSNTATVLTTDAFTGIDSSDLPTFYLRNTSGDMYGEWINVTDVLPNRGSSFSSLRLTRYMQSSQGRKLKLVGMKAPAALSAEADDTVVPTRYVLYAAGNPALINLTLREPSAHSQGTQFVGRWNSQEQERLKNDLAFERIAGTVWGGYQTRQNGYEAWATNPFSGNF